MKAVTPGSSRAAWASRSTRVAAGRAFRIARGVETGADLVHVRLVLDGIVGLGEAAPQTFLSESRETVLWAVDQLTAAIDDPWDWGGVHERGLALLGPGHSSAKSAVEMAVLDWCAQSVGMPVWQLVGLSPGASPASTFTLGIAAAQDVVAQGVKLSDEGWRRLKVKLGGGATPKEEALVLTSIARALPHVELSVDANEGWNRRHALAMLDCLDATEVVALEQPLPASDVEGLRELHRRSPVPVILDESIHSVADVRDCADRCSGVNIKISKLGGFLPSLTAMRTARELGLLVMLGCMGESSLGVAPAVHLAPLADNIDLDGTFFLAEDPAVGLRWNGDVPERPTTPGWGVRLADGDEDEWSR